MSLRDCYLLQLTSYLLFYQTSTWMHSPGKSWKTGWTVLY